jgi:Tol biopolymer transport system component
MRLSAGDKLGPYQILAPLGAGGMGEVYCARDTKLDRDVAIKILPDALARDPERLARFEREAKVLAALNHPNIAQIYGISESEGARALIMELVPGETLKGPLPLDTALKYAGQIASALEAAHEKGITHRDLKPANIMVTPAGVVKLLDFGLAAQSREAGPASENSPTLTLGATQAGVILGTAAYMSPEQASGQPVDRRSDIWSFGVVLLEMLTGERTFSGETVSHVLAAVLAKDPDCSRAPFPVQRLLKSCLQKDPRQRLQAIGDWRLLLAEEQSRPQPAEVRASKLPWIAVAALAVIAAAGYYEWWRATRPVEHPLIRLSADLGPEAVTGARFTVAISPDGNRVVYLVRANGAQLLATRLLNQATPTILQGTEGGYDPFFSPDGQWIGFAAGTKLKKISVLGGAAVTLCDAPGLRGASWGEDGFIVATLTSSSGNGLSRLPDSGGTPQPLTKPAETSDTTQRWPQVLPEGKGILLTGSATNQGFDTANIEVLPPKNGKVKVVQRGGYFGRYISAGGSQGHLIYIHEGALYAVGFDLDKLETRGTPVPILEDVAADAASGGGQLDVSPAGVLVYRSGKNSGSNYPVVLADSSGKTQPFVATPGQYYTPRFSPDGKRLAVGIGAGKGIDVSVYDPQLDSMTHLTFTGQREGATNSNPVWTPDGKHIVYTSQDQTTATLWWARSDGGGNVQKLRENKVGQLTPFSFAPDGRLAFMEFNPQTSVDIWTMPLDLSDPEHPKPGKAEKFQASPQVDAAPMFSPDGHWMAYSTNEQGTFEVFVRRFPGPGGPWQVSTNGGAYPSWSRDGKTLFFTTSGPHISAVEYTVKGDSFTYGKPRQWSDAEFRPAGGNQYAPIDLAPDGKHFAIFPRSQGEEEKGNVHATFLFNFFDEVRRRAPAGK